jgi:CubicO group peptidase (beta-lactamase class C family)
LEILTMMNYPSWVCVATACAALACSSSDHAGQSTPGATTHDFSAFDRAMDRFVAGHGLEGAGAVIVDKEHGIVHEQAYGSFAPDRLYVIASSSKVMSVGVLMKLVDEGKLDLDKPVSTYLPAWGTYKTDITTAELVSNSSGLVSLTDNPLYAKYLCQYIYTGTLSDCAKQIYTADDAADRSPPDTKFDYGGGQWQLAGGIAEVVGGKKWADLINDTYGGCDVPSIGYTNQFALAYAGDAGLAGALSYPKFFHGDKSKLPVTDNPSIEGGAYTTVHDYAAILLMHLRGGVCGDNRILSETSVKRMQQDRIGPVYGGSTIDPTLQGYGLGWWVDRAHPGIVADAGAYGAMPWIDNARGYAAFIVVEATADVGVAARTAVQPVVEAIFDGKTPDAG